MADRAVRMKWGPSKLSMQQVASGTSFAVGRSEEDEEAAVADEIVEVAENGPWSHRALTLALTALLLYYALGIFFYTSVVESMDFTDAVYFITVTITTVGFGFIHPNDRRSRVFTICYVFLGMCLVALCFVEVANLALDAREKLKQRMRATAVGAASSEMRAALSDTEGAAGASQPTRSPFQSANGDASPCVIGSVAKAVRQFTKDHPILVILIYVTIFLLVFGAIFWVVETGHKDLHYGDAVYFAMISATTIGYGDFFPTTKASKWCIIFLLPPSVVFMSWSLKSIAYHILGDIEEEKRHTKLMQANLSLSTLLEMVDRREIGEDGTLNEYHYMSFMLVRSGLVPVETLQSLHENFRMLDADGSGDLTREDLALIYAASTPKPEPPPPRTPSPASSAHSISSSPSPSSPPSSSVTANALTFPSESSSSRDEKLDSLDEEPTKPTVPLDPRPCAPTDGRKPHLENEVSMHIEVKDIEEGDGDDYDPFSVF